MNDCCRFLDGPSFQPTFDFAAQSVFRPFQANGTATVSFSCYFVL